MRVHRAVLLIPALLLAACQSTRPASEPDGSSFIVLQINDVYEISPLDRGRVGGMARVAAVLKRLEAENPNTIAVLAGDFLSPSLISSLGRRVDGREVRIAGEQMVDVLNAAGLDYATFGNHEFDVSETSLLDRIEESEFSYVSANVRRLSGTDVAPFVQDGAPIPDYVVHEFPTPEGTLRLGILGLTLPFNQAAYVAYEEVYDAARRSFREAERESDLIFALTHLSLEEDATLARSVPGMPLILGGHEHEATLASVGTTRITKADANARTVYIHRISYDRGTNDVHIASELMPITNAVPEDPETARVVGRWEAMADSLIETLGYTAREVIATFDTLYDGREASIRNFPTRLGRLVASAMLHADPSAELAVLNSGSIRIDDQLIGAIQQRDVLRTLPFGGPIVRARLPGDVFQRLLAVGLGVNKGNGGYLQTTPNISVSNGEFLVDGATLDPERTYRVVLPQFLSQGREKGLEFLADDPSWYEVLELRGAGGAPRNDLRDVVILYLKETDG